MSGRFGLLALDRKTAPSSSSQIDSVISHVNGRIDQTARDLRMLARVYKTLRGGTPAAKKVESAFDKIDKLQSIYRAANLTKDIGQSQSRGLKTRLSEEAEAAVSSVKQSATQISHDLSKLVKLHDESSDKDERKKIKVVFDRADKMRGIYQSFY